jgi:hypothetical protein
MTDSAQHIWQFFEYLHLPPLLQETSKLYSKLADEIMDKLPDNPERDMAMRKLLESKDCAVRAKLAEVNEISREERARAERTPLGTVLAERIKEALKTRYYRNLQSGQVVEVKKGGKTYPIQYKGLSGKSWLMMLPETFLHRFEPLKWVPNDYTHEEAVNYVKKITEDARAEVG